MALTEWLKENKIGHLLFAPHPIRLRPDKYREPDVMVWLNEHRDRMRERESGPPDLAVEIDSATNEAHDTGTKFREYAEAGISEYWIVNPRTRLVSVFVLETGAYKLVADFGVGGHARSSILTGFEIAVASLFPAAS